MKPADRIKKLINESDVTTSSDADKRILADALKHLDKLKQKNSAVEQSNIWRTIMKSKMTKLAAAAVIIIAVLFLITFFDKVATPAYALEQTIKANHTIKTIHLRMFKDGQSIENNEFLNYWIKYDNAGKLSNLRCNEHDNDGVRFTVWNDGVSKAWIPENNVVIIIRENNTGKEFEDFAKEFDPKLSLQRLYDMSMEEEEIELKIDEPTEDSNSIYVKATHSGCKERVDLVVDRQTKLMKKFSKYCLKDQEYKLDMRIEFLAYNKPIDMSVFQLSGIPDDALVYDQVDQLVGLEKGDLTNEEIAAKVVREGLKATIAKDYGQVRRLMEGDPGGTIEEFVEEEFEARLVRIISIGQPEPDEKFKHVLCVPCEIEVEDEERGRWRVNIIATAMAIEYQPGNRWIMHTDLRGSEPYIPLTSAFNEKDRIKGNLIVLGVGVADYTLGMSKDEVLKKLGEPKGIFYGGERYTLDNLPRKYYMFFGDISFRIDDDSVVGITVLSSLYKFTNGLGVGDSEQKIKQVFGDDFHFEEGRGKDFITYEDKGLQFEIHKKDRTVMEINVYGTAGDHGDSDAPEQREKAKHTIVPGLGVGDYTLGMSKDEVLRKLGEPEEIFFAGEMYTLDNLPKRYFMSFGDISFRIDNDTVKGITAISPYYKFTNGLGVGDSEQKIKQAFGDDFQLGEFKGADHLAYEDEGLMFEIHKKSRTVMEINLYQPKRNPEGPRVLKALPKYDPNSENPFQVDLRGRDLSKLDLRASLEDLMYANFDDRTVWPASDRM
ncbi:MAG: hypothetical protein ACXACF_09525, partial [Candidatus Hermodarchaeia archaeon]